MEHAAPNDTTEAKPDRHVMRMLAQQIAVAQIDGLRDIERAARRALRAYKRGSTAGLDSEAKECLGYAHDSCVRVLVDDEIDIEARRMSARKPRLAALEYSVHTRSDRPPRIGDTLQLGKQEYEVVSLRLRVELRPLGSDAEDTDDE